MRAWMILGGLIGFVIGLLLGLAQGSSWPTILWRASVGSLVMGMLLRWWAGVCISSLKSAERERVVAARAVPPALAHGKTRL